MADTMYQTGNDGATLFATNTANGASTAIGNFGYSAVYADAFDQSGNLYALVNDYADGTLARVNLSTGAATVVAGDSGIEDLMAMAFAPDGTLYVGSWATNDLYRMDPNTGAVTLIGSLGFSQVMGFSFGSNGQMYAIASGQSGGSGLFSINLSTGQGTLVTNISADNCLMGLAIGSSNAFYATDWCSSDSPLYQIDATTGDLTNLGLTGISHPMSGAIYQPQSTSAPEPGSLGLFGLGLIGVGALRLRAAWRRRGHVRLG